MQLNDGSRVGGIAGATLEQRLAQCLGKAQSKALLRTCQSILTRLQLSSKINGPTCCACYQRRQDRQRTSRSRKRRARVMVMHHYMKQGSSETQCTCLLGMYFRARSLELPLSLTARVECFKNVQPLLKRPSISCQDHSGIMRNATLCDLPSRPCIR